jgi:16S rRNA (uracil1498-N3)-methyltransferase
MHRFYLPPEECKEGALVLRGGEAHHALHVLRVRPGEQVTILDGAGQEFLCEIEATERTRVRLRILERKVHPALPWQITLCQALPKGKIIEAIIQKATELGAWKIVPLLSERVVSDLDDQTARDKQAKWQNVGIEAIKQCGSPWLPRVCRPLTPAEFLAQRERPELALVASLQPGSRDPREYFNAFRESDGQRPKSIQIWIGPEGDFTPVEVEQIQAAGAFPITLGPRVLRTETAAIYCLSVVNYELQSWT